MKNKKIYYVFAGYLIYAAIILILGITGVLEESYGNLIWSVGFITCGITILLNHEENYPFKSTGYLLNLLGFFGLAYYLFDIANTDHIWVLSLAIALILTAATILIFNLVVYSKDKENNNK